MAARKSVSVIDKETKEKNTKKNSKTAIDPNDFIPSLVVEEKKEDEEKQEVKPSRKYKSTSGPKKSI